MDKEAVLNGGLEEIQNIINDLNERDKEIQVGKDMAAEGKRLTKELQQAKDKAEEVKSQAVKQALADYIAEEDNIISNNKKKISEVERNRERAKNKGVKNRIENETEDLVAENRDIHRTIRKTMKENGLPAYCDTDWYYTLYCTQGGIQWAIKILVFIIGLVILPLIVTNVFEPGFKTKFLVVIVKGLEWLLTMFIFGAIYLTISLVTKDKDNGTLEAMREHRDKIADNKRTIRKIKRGIKSDKDESQYNLEAFDEELSALKGNLDEVQKERERKLQEFENDKKQAVIDEVEKIHNEIISNAEAAMNSKAEAYKAQTEKVDDLILGISENYGDIIPEKLLSGSGCMKIKELIESGQAADIKTAIEMLN